MKSYQKQFLCALSLLLLAPGCGGDKKKMEQPTREKKTISKEVDIPVAGDVLKNFFDEVEGDVQDFVLDEEDPELAKLELAQRVDTTSEVAELAWTQEMDIAQETCNKVYFEFDCTGVREDQQASLDANIELFKKKLADAGPHAVTIVVNGHACHSAGAETYNMSLSERRAREIRDYLVAHGINEKYIKIVGRGSAIPAMVDGKKVSGDREQQWPNRRVEFTVIYS